MKSDPDLSPLSAFEVAAPPPLRPARTQRASRAGCDGFELLDATHRAAREMLARFSQLVRHLDEHGLDVDAEGLAHEVLGFFEGPGRDHHAQEERWVFPELEALDDTDLHALVRRLRQDHHWIELDWRELRPHVRAVADGFNGYELPLLQAAVPVFEALYIDHMALEEQQVFPAAQQARARQAAGETAASCS
jgi:iron-sulfur cluster repair protein YtfE (RIC family)